MHWGQKRVNLKKKGKGGRKDYGKKKGREKEIKTGIERAREAERDS